MLERRIEVHHKTGLARFWSQTVFRERRVVSAQFIVFLVLLVLQGATDTTMNRYLLLLAGTRRFCGSGDNSMRAGVVALPQSDAYGSESLRSSPMVLALPLPLPLDGGGATNSASTSPVQVQCCPGSKRSYFTGPVRRVLTTPNQICWG